MARMVAATLTRMEVPETPGKARALCPSQAWSLGTRVGGPQPFAPSSCFKRPHSFQVLCVGRQGDVPCITERLWSKIRETRPRGVKIQSLGKSDHEELTPMPQLDLRKRGLSHRGEDTQGGRLRKNPAPASSRSSAQRGPGQLRALSLPCLPKPRPRPQPRDGDSTDRKGPLRPTQLPPHLPVQLSPAQSCLQHPPGAPCISATLPGTLAPPSVNELPSPICGLLKNPIINSSGQ